MTRSGRHGKTAQFWMIYIDLIHVYHSFCRSIRCGDFDLYVSCIPKLTNCFFALNHQNYARWLVRYFDNLLRLKDSHPDLYADFKKGWFAVRRSSRPFSSTPIDLALEQTINADAASQRGGITFFTNSISARQRWAESHFLRTTVISKFLDDVGLVCKEDVSRDLNFGKIQKDNRNVRQVIGMIRDTLNPFEQTYDNQYLYNIMTGKAAPTSVENCLLNITRNGEKARKKFIVECINDPTRFERRIPSQSLSTFASAYGKKKLKAKDGKLIEACLMRDVFGTLLCHGLENSIDICEILKHPLSPLPLSLCHPDGSFHKSPKSALMKHLESRVQSTPPQKIDAMFFLHLHQNLPSTFGGVARYLLKKILESDGSEIHFVSDKWIEPSIKDAERQKRVVVTSSELYAIRGPCQKRPNNWISALKSSSFKKNIIEFLVLYWKEDIFADMYTGKTLFANLNDVCFKYCVMDGTVVVEEVSQYSSAHEGADTRMFFHLAQLPMESNVVIRTNDTDCLIVALGCKHLFDTSINIWLEVGIQSNNSLRYISVNQMYSHLGQTLCKALPVYHALTGCDYTASFSRRGKIAPLKILEKNEYLQYTFGTLASNDLSPNTVDLIEKFICTIYSKPSLSRVDDVRAQIFFQKYRSKDGQRILSLAKKFDPSLMPPCRKVLVEKIKRTCFVAKRWMLATLPFPPVDNPLEAGWKLIDGRYEVFWYDGEPFPDNLNVMALEDDDADDSSDNDFVMHFEDSQSDTDSDEDGSGNEDV